MENRLNEKTAHTMESSQKGLAICSLTIGLLSFIGSFCFGIGALIALASLSIGIVAIVKKQGGMAIAGTILSIFSLIMGLLWMGFIIILDYESNRPENYPFNEDASYYEDSIAQSDNDTLQTTASMAYKVGDRVEVKNDQGTLLYTITVTKVALQETPISTIENTDVQQVVKIDYEYHNLNVNSKLLITAIDFRLLDEYNQEIDIYPLKGAFPKAASMDETAQGSTYYGLIEPSSTLTLLYKDDPFSSQVTARWNLKI